jgi:hypothetical protein
MTDHLTRIISKHSIQGMVIDSPILVLHAIGSHDRSLIAKFKRTQPYTAKDFDLLNKLLANFRAFLATPQILAEASNLLGQLPEPYKQSVFAGPFRSLIGKLTEQYVVSEAAAESTCFPKFGLTDCTIEHLSKTHAVLTADFALYGLLSKQNADVINFNHYRDFFTT